MEPNEEGENNNLLFSDMASPSPASTPTTTGELLFKNYLDTMQYEYKFEKEFPGRKKRPDYTVTKNGELFLFDVKDFEPDLPMGFTSFDPYVRLRERIHAGRKKFKEFKNFPCCVVLQNNGNAYVHSESPHIVLGAMYGNAGFKIPIYLGKGAPPKERPEPTPAFLGGGKMIRKGQHSNTTISALITLRQVAVGMRQYRKMLKKFPNLTIDETLAAAAEQFTNFDLGEKQLGVIVWENAVARIPLTRELFTGPYDLRWGAEGDHQTIVFCGEKLAEVEDVEISSAR
jgi:hypothetical protein